MESKKNNIYVYIAIFLFTLIAIPFIIKYLIYFPTVDGTSMEPSFHAGQVLICKRFNDNTTINRFDVITFDYESKNLVKRVIALPGETVYISKDGIFVNDELLEENYGKEPMENYGLFTDPVTLSDDEYFVLGDNRNDSVDSRMIGPVKRSEMTGLCLFKGKKR